MSGYRTVCEAKTEKDMLAAFDTVLSEIAAECGGTKDSHRNTQLSNVGYFAGYYDADTYARVHKWLGTSHPIFGTAYPTPEKAIVAGKRRERT